MRSATNMPMELNDFLKRENINTSNVFSFKLGLKVHFIIYILTLFHIVFHDLVSFPISDGIFNARLKMMNTYLSIFFYCLCF